MKVLAVGAHPDDIEIYMFGLLSNFLDRGDNVRILIATDGAAGSKYKDLNLKEKRYKETLQALKNFSKPTFLNLKDGSLSQSDIILNLLENNFKKIKPDLIITHSPEDYHPDHRHLSRFVSDVASFKYPVLYADTLLGINFIPNYFVDITKFFEKKIKAINYHKSQNPIDYINAVKIWNSFRAAQCNAPINYYAEAYRFEPRFPFNDIRSILPDTPKIQPTSLFKLGGLI